MQLAVWGQVINHWERDQILQMLPFVGLWNEWGIHILVLLSFTIQVLLHLFGGVRRLNASVAFRILIWLVYMLADSTATYTIGRIASSCEMSQQQFLVAFWAQFLLLHLGGQDNITAYALEDNELWLRHLLNLGVQAIGVTYLLYKYIAGPRLLIPASILVFVAGVLKYGERIWALKCASMSSMQRSVVRLYLDFDELQLFRNILNGTVADRSTECDSFAMYRRTADAAHLAFEFSKRIFVTPSIASEWRCPRDYLNPGVYGYRSFGIEVANDGQGASNYSGRTHEGPWIPAKQISEVIDLELSLMYDLFYTKSAVIHTWYGYSIRAFSFLAIVSALMLFISTSRETGYTEADVAVTYVLLIGASALEITSIVRAIGSTWTYANLSRWIYCREKFYFTPHRKLNRFARILLSLRWHLRVRLGRWFGSLWKHDTVSSEKWPPTSIGQFNIISASTTPRTDFRWKIAKLIYLEDLWNKAHHLRFIQASPAVMEAIYTEIKRRAELTEEEANKFDDNIHLGRWTRSYDELANLSEEVCRMGLVGFVLVCHVATDIFVHCCDEDEKIKTAGDLPEVAVVLSNYMMYLLQVHLDILPTTQDNDRWSSDKYDETCNRLLPEVFNIIKRYRLVEIKQERGHRPQDILLNMKEHLSKVNGRLQSFRWINSVEFKLLNMKEHLKKQNKENLNKVNDRLLSSRWKNSVFRSGSELAAKLLETEINLRQKFQFLAELWVDTLLHVADGITAKFHAKQLTYGGEFVTFVSVLMIHVGLHKQLNGPYLPKGDGACVGDGTNDNGRDICEEPDSTRVDVEMQPVEALFRKQQVALEPLFSADRLGSKLTGLSYATDR